MGTRALTVLVAMAGSTGAAVGLAGCCVIMVLGALIRAHGAAVLVTNPGAPGALALLGLIVARAAMTARPLIRAWQLHRWCLHSIGQRGVSLPLALRQLAADAGIRRLHLIADDTAAAFTVGLVRPRVMVTTALLAALDHDELAAVLRHEAEHARRRDPLRLLVGQVAQGWVFFLPVAEHLRRQAALGAELAADRAAVRHHGPRPVAGALVRLAAVPNSLTAAFVGGATLAARVRQLETGLEPAASHASRRARALTAAGTLALAWMTLSAAIITLSTASSCMA